MSKQKSNFLSLNAYEITLTYLGHLIAETRVKVRSFLNRKEEVAGTNRSTVNRSRWLSGRASASGAGGRGFEPRPRHTKGVKMVPVATLLGAQHYKASTGSPLTQYEHCTITKKKRI